jgi:hypothetical protein
MIHVIPFCLEAVACSASLPCRVKNHSYARPPVAHPGCTEEDMRKLKSFVGRELKTNPQQVQIFTPLPFIYSSLMYFTEIDPATGRNIFVEKKTEKKQRQKDIVVERK